MEVNAGEDWPVGAIRHKRKSRVIMPKDPTELEEQLVEDKRNYVKLRHTDYRLAPGSAAILKAKGYGKRKSKKSILDEREAELKRRERALEAFEYRLKKLEESTNAT